MCYGKPAKLLNQVIAAQGLPKNDLGHSAIDDFEHFCAYTGCDPKNNWAKLAFIVASQSRRPRRQDLLDDTMRKHCADISMLLRDHPPGTTADITDHCVLYWDGDQLVGAHLSPEVDGAVDEPFDIDESCLKFLM